uniref:Sequence orphan n=1 Tax=Angiostrongylus cantonensis TaxID=6313 RepID=A0A0K0CYP8_ANGCA
MAKVDPECIPPDVPEGTTDSTEDPSAQNSTGERNADGSDHPVPGTYFNGTPHIKRPQPAKVFFAPQKYGFFTLNKVEQRWRDDPEKDKKTHADDIIANVTGIGSITNSSPVFDKGWLENYKKLLGGTSSVIPPGIPPPPFMVPPAASGRDGKRIKFNDEESDENELFGMVSLNGFLYLVITLEQY